MTTPTITNYINQYLGNRAGARVRVAISLSPQEHSQCLRAARIADVPLATFMRAAALTGVAAYMIEDK